MRIKELLYYSSIAMLIFLSILMCKTSVQAEESNDTYLSEEICASCREYGLEYDICPELLEAIIEVESAGQQDATNGSCYGICQINGDTWGYEYDTEDKQIDMCCQIILEYRLDCDDVAHVLSRYAGYSNANELCEKGELSDYARKVLERSAELQKIHHGL